MLEASWRKLLHQYYALGELRVAHLPGRIMFRFPNSKEETWYLLPQNHTQHREKDRKNEKEY